MRRPDGKRITKLTAALPDFEDLGRPFVPALRAGQMIFTSGTKARDRKGAVLHPHDPVEPARDVQNNLLQVPTRSGADPPPRGRPDTPPPATLDPHTSTVPPTHGHPNHRTQPTPHPSRGLITDRH